MKILFVCTGNTCRSPMAQAILQEKIDKEGLTDFEADSAGIFCGYGEPMSGHTAQIIDDMGLFFTHTSQPVTPNLLSNCDMVVTMTKEHKNMLVGHVEESKLFSFDELTGNGDIADPYGGDSADYLAVEMQLRRGMDAVVAKAKSLLEIQ
ncbi:MAG: low molecular weight protein arginine phosphatase [Clostridia bacterium]|nr:low molecular weight protein arginine phosphatase [Clostridia bacterium]